MNWENNKPPTTGEAEGLTGIGSGAGPEGDRQSAEERGHGGHHDGPEAQNTAGVDGVEGAHAFGALGFNGEIDHHDGVLLHDAEEHDQADKGVEVEILMEDLEREQRAEYG